MPDETKKFYGKYRGTVMNNIDPMQMGRIQAIVPDVLGPIPTSFAMPCLPITGKQMGTFMLPQIGSGVWIEFEQGNPDYPIWTGCFWAENEVPISPASADKKVLKTNAGTITLDDTSGSNSITIETTNNLKIKMDQQGIEISNGSQKIMVSSSSVSINDGALEIT